MPTCKQCNTEVGDGKFCPNCGAYQTVQVTAPPVEVPQSGGYSEQPAYVPEPFVTPGGDSGSIPPVNTAPPSYGGQAPLNMPSSTGQVVFSIINIVFGVLLCCCYGISLISMVLGIIALVMAVGSSNAGSIQNAQNKLKTARVLNIVGVAALAVAVVIAIVLFALVGSNSYPGGYFESFMDEFENRFGYYY